MSAFLYGRLESKREGSQTDQSTSTAPPALKTYADAFLALVPAEVLAAAVVFVKSFTETTKEAGGKQVVTVTDHDALQASFYGCIVLATVLYVAGHIKIGAEKRKWDRWDFLRMLIPAGAFIGWTMAVEPATMFDNAIKLGQGWKVIAVVFGAIGLGLVAAALGMKADKKNP